MSGRCSDLNLIDICMGDAVIFLTFIVVVCSVGHTESINELGHTWY